MGTLPVMKAVTRALPLPIRVAAGLAVVATERARELPTQLAGLPVTLVSQVLQTTMRLQQQLTELAIKGDEALATFRPVEETPSWAIFDEDELDIQLQPAPAEPGEPDHESGYDNVTPIGTSLDDAPSSNGHPVISELPTEQSASAPAGVAGYDDLTLPQLRARLRRFSLSELDELLSYERAHANRASFIGMLSRRIGNVRRGEQANDSDAGPSQSGGQ